VSPAATLPASHGTSNDLVANPRISSHPDQGMPNDARPRTAAFFAFAVMGGLLLVIGVWVAATAGAGLAWLETADAHYVLLSLATLAATLVAVHRSQGPARRAWWLLAAAIAVNVVADVAYIVVEALEGTPWVSFIDVLYLAGYPFLLAALWVLARARSRAEGPKAMLDGLVLALSLGLLAWQFVLVAPGGMAEAEGLLARVVLVAYPMWDLLLLGGIAGVLLVPGHRSRSLWCLTAFFLTYFASDIAYAVFSYTSDTALRWIDVGYMAANYLVGLAALSPDAGEIAEPQPSREPGLGRFVLLAAAAVTPGLAAALTLTVSGGVNPWVLVSTSAAVAVLLSVRIASLLRDEHRARHAAEEMREELRRRALEDDLTGLPNRQALFEAITSLPQDQVLSLLLVDLDRFKVVNDTAGHRSGDVVLRDAAARIRAAVRAQDRVHRLGGDEFVVLCPGIPEAEAEGIALRIIDELAAVFRVDAMEWFVGASIGVASGRPEEFAEPEDLVDAGDIAMYVAKRDPVRAVARFDDSMKRHLHQQHTAELNLRRALDEDRIEAAFQPIVRLDDQSIAGFETLARWRRSDGALVSAAEFLPLAEQTGLVDEIDRRMLERAARFAKSFNERHLDHAPAFVTVNLSPHHLASDVAATVGATVERVGMDPTDLVVELTEGALAIDPELAVRRLSAVRDLGVMLAIDDFGTGYSSLAQLLRFPVDFVKVDQFFVKTLGTVPARRSGAAAALHVADTLGIRAIAEGVETTSQADVLRSLGYTYAQGMLLGPPMSTSEAARLDPVPTGQPVGDALAEGSRLAEE
jgi:diguanylate cyclase (GGDEF)-like protein